MWNLNCSFSAYLIYHVKDTATYVWQVHNTVSAPSIKSIRKKNLEPQSEQGFHEIATHQFIDWIKWVHKRGFQGVKLNVETGSYVPIFHLSIMPFQLACYLPYLGMLHCKDKMFWSLGVIYATCISKDGLWK